MRDDAGQEQSAGRAPQLVVVALTLLALVLRIWRLESVPAGLHFDEAGNGLLIQDHIFRGETPVFFSAYAGREALFQYTQAPFLALLGPRTLALRLPAAIWSSALVPVAYLLGRRLWGWRQGLMAALAVACGGWLVHVGRIGFRANTLPVVSGLAILLLLQALTGNPDRNARPWLLSGALFGLSLYTYLAVRMLPLLAPLLLIYLAIWHRSVLQLNLRGIGIFAVALLVVATPLAIHMVRVPSDFFARIGQIGVSNSQETSRVGVGLAQTWATLQMFGVRGARDGFFNLPFRPVFPGPAVLPFYGGVLLALWHWRKLTHTLVLLWLGVMLVPTILAADAPHWLRAIGAAPATYLLWGLGAGSAWAWLARRWRAGTIAGWLALVVFASWWTQATAQEYFRAWAGRPELYYEYMQYASDAAQIAAQVPPGENLLISEEYYRHATYLFLAPRTYQAQWFDARHAVVWPRSTPWTMLVSRSTPTTLDFAPLLTGTQGEPYTPNGLYAYTKLHGATIPPFDPPQAWQADIGGALRLRGIAANAPQPGKVLHLQLWAEATAAPGRELRIFAHLETRTGQVISQDDALGYDAREWQAGDRFISFHDLPIPSTLPNRADLRLTVGLYDVVTGERLATSGAGASGDFVELPLPE